MDKQTDISAAVVVLDSKSHTILYGGRIDRLSALQYAIMLCLLKASPNSISRQALILQVGASYAGVATSLHRLRTQLKRLGLGVLYGGGDGARLFLLAKRETITYKVQ